MLILISIALLLLVTSVFIYNRTFLINKFVSPTAALSQPANLSLLFHGNGENDSVYVSKGSSTDKADNLSMEIDDLEWLLEKKKNELIEIRREKKLEQDTAAQVDMIQDTIDSMESKIATCQQQLAALKPVAVDLDELEINYQQLKNELAQSQHNYQDIAEENVSLREQLDMCNEELNAVLLEKQKLHRKIMILESLNQDLQSMADAWKAKSNF
jgi:chromosome segregation ATPase